MKTRSPDNQRGSIILVLIITLPFLILIVVYYMQLSLASYQVGRLDQLHSAAQLAADAGADYAIEQISQNNGWTGTGGEYTLHNGTKTRTTFTDTVANGTGIKTVRVVGRTYAPASSSQAARSVTIAVDLRPVTSGNYSVISGAGGLYMSDSSKIVGGSVFINGEIHLSNTAQIGLSTAPATVQVADQICPNPPDATYPRVCTAAESSPPIVITNAAHITGTVTATNQSDGQGMDNPGLVSGSVSPQPLPTYDRAGQQAAITSTILGTAASCSGTQSLTIPANTKITGNVSISGSCNVTVLGNVWITGTLTLTNSAKMVVADTLGSTVPTLMVDGSGGVTLRNSAQLVPNSSGTGFRVVTFYSLAGCSPDCTSVTGSALANSRSVTTIFVDQTASAPSSVLYAYWTQVKLNNSGQVGALIGQTVQLSNAAAVNFGNSSAGSTTVWVVQGYRRQ